jgi:hypothetical protein
MEDPMAGQPIAHSPIGTPSLQQATGKSGASPLKGAKGSGYGQHQTSAVVSTTTITNPDGSSTTTTSYANGSRATTTTPGTASRSVPQLLANSNPAQLQALLAAQEQAQKAGAQAA